MHVISERVPAVGAKMSSKHRERPRAGAVGTPGVQEVVYAESVLQQGLMDARAVLEGS